MSSSTPGAVAAAWHQFGALLAYWGSAYFAPSRCHCHCPEPVVDPGLLGILRDQLNRCGPSQLAPVCPPCSCHITGIPDTPLISFAFIFLFGCFVGGFIVYLILHVRLRRAASPSDSEPASASSRLPTGLTPSALKHLKDGRASANPGSS